MSNQDVFIKLSSDLSSITDQLDKLESMLNSHVDTHTSLILNTIKQSIFKTVSDFKVQEYNIERALEKWLEVKQDLDLAIRVQKTIFPSEKIYLRDIEFAGFTKAARSLGGDYYTYQVSNNGIHAAIGDVSGKGIGNALITLMIDNYYKGLIYEDITLDGMLIMLNQFFTQLISGYELLGQKFMTFLTFKYTGDLEYAGAGHEYILHYHGEQKTVERIRTGGVALGLTTDFFSRFSKGNLVLKPGDVIVTYSDGIPDTRNELNQQYGLDRLAEFVEKNGATDPENLINNIIQEVEKYQGNHGQYDDLTLLIIKKPIPH